MKYLLKSICVTVILLSLSACSKRNDKAPNIDARTGRHPAGWVAANTGGLHPAAFLGGPSACYECHGRDLKGGVSGASCFSTSRNGINCHANGPSGHPAGWSAPDAHGRAAKTLAAGVNGYAHCQLCHGTDFNGGIAKKSCLNTAGCHGSGIMAAHPPKPWRDVGRTGARSHTTTDTSNAAGCAACHAGGANSTRTPSPAAPAGTAPGCFNNTLCHGVEGHATGWKSYSSHGRAAKAATGGVTVKSGFSPVSSLGECIACHGVSYDGGAAQQSCLNSAGCHGASVSAPHPGRPWRALTGGATHTNTDTSNALQCAACHTAGANSIRKPLAGEAKGVTGCFDATMCHGVEGHAAGWSAGAQHGSAAKGAKTTNAGFASCQMCHGPTFNNGPAPSCMNSLGCHGLLVSSPHPAKPWTSRIAAVSTHTNTAPENAGTCDACHRGGSNSEFGTRLNVALGEAKCFNNTLCHFHQIPFAPSATVPVSLHGGEARKDLSVCQGCHGGKGTTAFDGTTLADGTKTVACSSCHTFAKAHPTDWQGSGTYSHRTAGIANACALCHDVTHGRSAPLPAAPSCFSATFANQGGAGQARTCHANGPGVAPHAVKYPNHNATARNNPTYCLGCHQVAANALNSKPPGCMNCHLSSPVATSTGCTSCHSNAPAGSVYPDIAGSHAKHGALNSTTLCAECHNGLGLGTVDHLDRARQRASGPLANPLSFGALAKSQSTAASSCATTWCHGGNTSLIPQNFRLRSAPVWGTPFPGTSTLGTGGTASVDSGSGYCAQCHGYPPMTASHNGVTTEEQCNGCHVHLNTDGITFNNPAKHVNGTIDASNAHGFPYPGSEHKGASSFSGINCAACHDTTTAFVSGGYPVVRGTAPKCAGCHLTWSNGTCSDCHGSGSSGQPNGSVFPNRAGRHNTHSSIMGSCDYCHFGGGTGAAAHGNQGGTLKTVRSVIIGKNPARYTGSDTITITQNASTGTVTCVGSCHMGSDSQNHNYNW